MLTLIFLPDLDSIPKPTLIPIPVELEHEPTILDSYISLLENKCELEFYDLDQIHEPTMKGIEIDIDSGIKLKSSLGSRVGVGSCSSSTGIGISVGFGIESKSGKKIRVSIDSKNYMCFMRLYVLYRLYSMFTHDSIHIQYASKQKSFGSCFNLHLHFNLEFFLVFFIFKLFSFSHLSYHIY